MEDIPVRMPEPARAMIFAVTMVDSRERTEGMISEWYYVWW